MSFAKQRKEYSNDGPLDLGPDPIAAFIKWYEEAKASSILEPNAMSLATATSDGRPSARMVLLKGVLEQGFVFYTNFHSRKGQELLQNPQAALCWYWDTLERQVRAVGTVAQLSPAESDEYFASRPRGAQVSACLSKQSELLIDRSQFERECEEFLQQNENQNLSRPEHWGGYIVEPQEIEFWQGVENRLHHRYLYQRTSASAWTRQELYP